MIGRGTKPLESGTQRRGGLRRIPEFPSPTTAREALRRPGLIQGVDLMPVKRIAPDDAKKLLDSGSGYVYLDVRTVPEFEAGHVPGAKNVPVFEPDRHGRMGPNPRFVEIVETRFGKDARYIVACQMGGRSLHAAEMLVAAGFTDVADMLGGYGQGWAPRGLPTTCESAPEDRYDALALP
jgi:rhodanese-related sulfurtransferase